MSWRFRKSFKVLPGVKLNLTRRGLSATLGAAPFSVNVGPRGVYRNISIPGTGLWDRQRVDVPRVPVAQPPPFTPEASAQKLGTEIRSTSTELLGSHSMEDVRRALQVAYEEVLNSTGRLPRLTMRRGAPRNDTRVGSAGSYIRGCSSEHSLPGRTLMKVRKPKVKSCRSSFD
jgi:hypothetical protein